ncbi:MAG: endonuclease V [Syntrophaceae bacterium]
MRNAWPATLSEARLVQESLRTLVQEPRDMPEIRLVAGVDAAYAKDSHQAACAVVVLRLPELELVDQAQAYLPVKFPYVPGFLSFREGPLIVKAAATLGTRPDAWLFDGHGICHPSGVGLATHLGLVLDIASIGCAKDYLCGEYEEPGNERGCRQPIRLGGRLVGSVLRTRTGVKPVFVSIGHKMNLETACEVCLQCSHEARIPEPLRQAHSLSRRMLREAGCV